MGEPMAYLGGISAKLEKRLSLARKYGPTTQAIAERIAAKYGGYTTPINYKSYNSASGWGHSMYEDFRAISNKNRRGMTVKKGKAKGETNKNYITRQNSRDYYDIFNK